MKKLMNLVSIILFAVVITSAQPVFADTSVSTSTDTEAGQVQVVSDEDGIIQLSIDTNPATKSATVSTSSSTLLGEPVVVPPTGFADTIGQLITALLTFIMVIAALLVLLQLILAGIKWITSGGDKGKIEEARNQIISAVIGIIILAASWAILLLVLNFLGFENLQDVFDDIQTIS